MDFEGLPNLVFPLSFPMLAPLPNDANDSLMRMLAPTERSYWSVAEDLRLAAAVKLKGPAWKMISEMDLPNYTGDQCRERYVNHVDPTIDKSVWTHQDYDQLFFGLRRYGRQFARIARRYLTETDPISQEVIRRRSELDVKNHFYHCVHYHLAKLRHEHEVCITSIQPSVSLQPTLLALRDDPFQPLPFGWQPPAFRLLSRGAMEIATRVEEIGLHFDQLVCGYNKGKTPRRAADSTQTNNLGHHDPICVCEQSLAKLNMSTSALLRCQACSQWFHSSCLAPMDRKIYHGEHVFMQFTCARCNGAHELLLEGLRTWAEMGEIAIVNLMLETHRRAFTVNEIATYLDKHWDDLCELHQEPWKPKISFSQWTRTLRGAFKKSPFLISDTHWFQLHPDLALPAYPELQLLPKVLKPVAGAEGVHTTPKKRKRHDNGQIYDGSCSAGRTSRSRLAAKRFAACCPPEDSDDAADEKGGDGPCFAQFGKRDESLADGDYVMTISVSMGTDDPNGNDHGCGEYGDAGGAPHFLVRSKFLSPSPPF